MKNDLPLVYIIILNYNGWRDTIECLESVYRNSYPNYRVIVIENGSQDGSAEKIGEWIKKSKLVPACFKQGQEPVIIDIEKNLGFAGGNNVGILHALKNDADYMLLLNNDTVVEKGFLKELVKITKDNDAGIIGGKIYYYGACGERSESNRNKIWYKGGRLNWLFGGGTHYGKGKYEKDKNEGIYEVTFITGCMMLIKKSTVERIGLLEESYFLYCEDTDYCARALKNHIKMAVNLSSVIYHKENSTLGGWKPAHIYYLIRNRFIFMKRHAPLSFRIVFHCLAVLIGTALISGWLLNGRLDLISASLRGMKDYLSGVSGPADF